MRGRCAALLSLAGALACGGTPAKKPTPPPKPSASAEPAPDKPPDLSPVTRPDNVIAVARVRSPGKVLGKLAQWRGSNWTSLLPPRARELGEVVAPDASLDVVVSIERRPAGPMPDSATVVSVGLTSLEAALAELRDDGMGVRRVSAGVFAIEDTGGEHCAVAAAAGAAPARLVCASSQAGLGELLPYAVRGLSREPSAAHDLHSELDIARVRALHGARFEQLKHWARPFVGLGLSQLDPRLDRALTPLLDSIFDELLLLLGDVDRVDVSATVGETELDANATLSLGRDPRALLAKTLFESGARQAPPPADFWRLPPDAQFAFFSHGMPASRAELFRRTLAGALSRGARSSVPKKTIDLIMEALFPESPFVYALGFLEPSLDLEPTLGGGIRRHTERVLGWHVLGIETDSKALGQRLDRGMNDYNAGPLRDFVYGEAPTLCKGMPKITRRPAPAKGLPAGSVLYEMLVPGKLFDDCAASSSYGHYYSPRSARARPSRPLSIAVVFAPGKPRSWIVISPNTEYALSKMRAVLASAPPTPSPPLDETAILGLWTRAGILPGEVVMSPYTTRPHASRERAFLSVRLDGKRTVKLSARLPSAEFRL